MIGLVTDSNSQITPELRERYHVEVVPLTVIIDGVEYAEGVDVDADQFYAFFDEGPTPEVSTSQPSPAAFVSAYRRLEARGAEAIVSVHVGSTMSGTVNVASLAAGSIDVPVEIIDTESASFGVSACVWSAGETIRRGGNVEDVRRRIEAMIPQIGSAFMVGVPLLTDRGGRAGDASVEGEGVPILVLRDGRVEVAARVTSPEDTVDVLATFAADWGDDVVVAVGTADAPSAPLADRLAAALTDSPTVSEITHYRIGPSVGAHTGPGTFGLVVFPTL